MTRVCVLCGRELPPLRWWQRFIPPPPICPTRDFEECHQRFMIGAGVVDEEGES